MIQDILIIPLAIPMCIYLLTDEIPKLLSLKKIFRAREEILQVITAKAFQSLLINTGSCKLMRQICIFVSLNSKTVQDRMFDRNP